MTIVGFISVFIVAFLLGFFYKSEFSININHNHKEIKEEPKEVVYNESMADELDPSIRQYYDNTNGLNKF